MNYKVVFKDLKWEVPFIGIKHKYLHQENIKVRLVEYDQKMPPHWCEKSHYGYVLEIGRIVMNDTCDRLMRSEDIQEFYLGAKEAGARGERRWKKKKTWR